MRLSLIISFLLLLPALSVASAWERSRPRTELPAVIIPKSDADCRSEARRIDTELLQARDAAEAYGSAAGMWIVQAGEPARRRFMQECVRPQTCPAFAETKRDVNQSDQPATDAYALMRELCGR